MRVKAHRRIAIGKLTAHHVRERSCRRDSFAGSLGAPFQYQGNVVDWKTENLKKTTLVTLLRLESPKLPMGWKVLFFDVVDRLKRLSDLGDQLEARPKACSSRRASCRFDPPKY
jgi:hypothetical protein